MNLLEFELALARVEGDLNGILTLVELSRQRDTTDRFWQRTIPNTKDKLKEMGQRLLELSSQDITPVSQEALEAITSGSQDIQSD